MIVVELNCIALCCFVCYSVCVGTVLYLHCAVPCGQLCCVETCLYCVCIWSCAIIGFAQLFVCVLVSLRVFVFARVLQCVVMGCIALYASVFAFVAVRVCTCTCRLHCTRLDCIVLCCAVV